MEKILFNFFQANTAQMCVLVRQKRSQPRHGCKQSIACERGASNHSPYQAKIRVKLSLCPMVYSTNKQVQ
ncbi:hypothetical protein A4A49_37808 [Nicotiana attenuata]|uniref:Uncharacterized protein n=1 Tax=Nicotiana attenuata TaxID=49451 RepID=A0A1J6IE18_NICAT|nr:hypothetical protein A4A49_37808 [Nicotiana attenuata]